MKDKDFNILSKKTRVLVTPLDWGLGHATRCIPLIRALLDEDCDVFIGADGPIRILLEKEFPQAIFLELPGYNIQYTQKGSLLLLKLFLQTPKIIRSIYAEHQWVKKVVAKYKIDRIIADNRLGIYHSLVPSAYITHQLLIKTGNSFTEKIAKQLHYWFIKKRTVCWIPDFKGANNLAGQLSHPEKLPGKTVYLGCLSRFKKMEGSSKPYDLLILISGPEPQRSIFEQLLLKQLQAYTGKVLFVRGLPNKENTRDLNYTKANPYQHITFENHLPADKLNIAIQESTLVISRSGYTTIMDLVKLQQKAVLVPTPGQTEQEYLATYLHEQQIFFTVEQRNFSLNKIVEAVQDFPFRFPPGDMEEYKKHLTAFISN